MDSQSRYDTELVGRKTGVAGGPSTPEPNQNWKNSQTFLLIVQKAPRFKVEITNPWNTLCSPWAKIKIIGKYFIKFRKRCKIFIKNKGLFYIWRFRWLKPRDIKFTIFLSREIVENQPELGLVGAFELITESIY